MIVRTLLSFELHQSQDVVVARQRTRQIAEMLGFELQDQIRLATAVSEVARNAFQFAGSGKIEFAVDESNLFFAIKVIDQGPGIHDVQAVLNGHLTGKTMGLTSVRRLMDHFQLDSTPESGTTVTFGKALPRIASAAKTRDLATITSALTSHAANPLDEVKEQNKELLKTLDELRLRQSELATALIELQKREAAVSELNRELEDTNRGVVALYAELEEKAEFLGRTSDMKSKFLSNVSHEFRTPLNAMTGLTRLLLDRVDGDLTSEQEKQVTLIRRAAENLTDLVNDLLDLAKVEAGKVTIRPTEFDISSLFGGLRGMLRPLLSANSSVDLIFVDPAPLTTMTSDESKVSQILRNFISNALKFTETGEIRIAAEAGPDDTITFSVADTGIGIAPQDQLRVFEEYTQIEGPLQAKTKGTGLGLPLVKKLTELLGGKVTLKSQAGEGSTFAVILPKNYHGPAEVAVMPDISAELDPNRKPVLFVEDNREALFIYDKYLKGSVFQVIPAPNLASARRALARFKPCAVVLDVLLDRESGWELLSELKQSEETRSVPVLVITLVENEAKARSLGAEEYCAKPVDRGWLLRTLTNLTSPNATMRILIIDDDEASRYLIREGLRGTNAELSESENGADGIRQVLQDAPKAIILDLELPDQTGLKVLETLKSSDRTRHIPVIINTSKLLDESEREALIEAGAIAVLSKQRIGEEGPALLREVLLTTGMIQ